MIPLTFMQLYALRSSFIDGTIVCIDRDGLWHQRPIIRICWHKPGHLATIEWAYIRFEQHGAMSACFQLAGCPPWGISFGWSDFERFNGPYQMESGEILFSCTGPAAVCAALFPKGCVPPPDYDPRECAEIHRRFLSPEHA